jgi:hypothetical protein
MATTQIKADLIINNANWQKGLDKASKQMAGFGKSMKTISNSIKGGLAFIGINAITGGLVDMAKAADEDAKSMRILNKVLENSWKATDEQTRAVDDFLQATSLQVGIVDDKLRPSFAKIATTVKDPTKAMEVFRLALDTATGTGKDLNVVSQAMAKFFGGQTTALDKLVPGIKDAGDKMEYLRTKFGGAAEEGAGAFDKINVAMENASETIGTALLPYVKEFAEWLGSSKGQASLNSWLESLKSMIKLAGDFLNIAGNVADLFNQDKKDSALTKAAQNKNGLNYLGGGQTSFLTTPQAKNMGSLGNMTLQVNVDPITGTKVTKLLKNTAKVNGIPMSKLLQ